MTKCNLVVTISANAAQFDRALQKAHIGVDVAKPGSDRSYLVVAKIAAGHVALEVIEEIVRREKYANNNSGMGAATLL